MADQIRFGQGYRYGQGWRYGQTVPDPPPAPVALQPKGKHMDYLPDKRSDRQIFYQDFSANVVTEGPKFNAPAGDATAAKGYADAILAAMNATNAAEAALAAARSMERNVVAANLPLFRAKVRLWKQLPGWAGSGSEGVLKLKGAAVDFNPSTYKPVFQGTVEAGKVRLDFEKRGVQRLKFFMRLRGQVQFNEVGTDSNPPYWDTTPLAQAGVAEVREYMARGVIDDEEIGLDSDIVSVTFGG